MAKRALATRQNEGKAPGCEIQTMLVGAEGDLDADTAVAIGHFQALGSMYDPRPKLQPTLAAALVRAEMTARMPWQAARRSAATRDAGRRLAARSQSV